MKPKKCKIFLVPYHHTDFTTKVLTQPASMSQYRLLKSGRLSPGHPLQGITYIMFDGNNNDILWVWKGKGRPSRQFLSKNWVELPYRDHSLNTGVAQFCKRFGVIPAFV